MAWPDRRQDALHRARQPMGERLLRKPQLEAPGRASERRDIHDAAGSSGADRELATTLQCRQAALVARLSAAGSRSDLAASIRSALRSAAASPDAGQPPSGSNLVPAIAMWGRPATRDTIAPGFQNLANGLL